MMKSNHKHVFIITGPTGSGKTELSLKLAEILPIEIINADSGQFYTPCSIGTAKPVWKDHPIPHHLFDILDSPQDLNVADYRKAVIEKVEEIFKRDKVPVIVGGSLFYIKSLFFPPQEFGHDIPCENYDDVSSADLWKRLFEIDRVRAEKIHSNDRYRITRALNIWDATKIKPSEYAPVYTPPFNAFIVVVKPKRDSLFTMINKRTCHMIGDNPLVGWLEEARKLLGTPWEGFLNEKKLVGYDTIFSWLRRGENAVDLPRVIETIQAETRQYAKRQITFYGSFKKILNACQRAGHKQCSIKEIESVSNEAVRRIIHDFKAYMIAHTDHESASGEHINVQHEVERGGATQAL